MKRINLFIPVLIFTSIITISGNLSFDDSQELARVRKMDGKFVFVMCQPVQEYEEVGKANTAMSALADQEKDISELVKSLLKKGNEREEKGKMEAFDGIITEDGAVGIFIKFK